LIIIFSDVKNIFADDINNKYTTVSNIQLTVTNYGTIGKGYCGTQPSCMYPKGSGIENLWLGGIWVGGYKNGSIHVSTGAIDVSGAIRQEGFEFSNAPGSIITERSSNITSPYYSPYAISHQDFVCEYYDTSLTGIQNHLPLGIKVLLESYAYDLNFANYFVILNYKIVNIGYNGDNSNIDSIYLGLWQDCVVRNINVTPGCNAGTSFYSKGANGYDSAYRIGYQYDYNGDPGFTDNYCGIVLLGVNPKDTTERTNFRTHYTTWQYKNTTDPLYFSPTDDNARFSKLKGFFNSTTVWNTTINDYTRLHAGNRLFLMSYGPFRKKDGSAFTLRYSIDTANIVFAVVCAKKYGTDPTTWDSTYQRKYLYSNVAWAQRAFDNGYKLPAPPDIPILRTEINDRNVTLWWTNNSEYSKDPISGKYDFEGYKVYRTNPGFDITPNYDLQTQLKLIADFDSCCNGYFNNTGFKFIKQSNYKTFTGDTNKYWYKFDFPNQLNGFQYVYTVTAYDKGDSSQNLGSLESSLLSNAKRIVVGTTPKDNSDVEIGVYPNPYYGSAYWDGTGAKKEVLRKIYFYNLPSKCEISIWTLAGDLVDRFIHDASTYIGTDIEWFRTYSDPSVKFSGGEHAWDLITKSDQALATGLYLFTVQDLNSGKIKKGKFLIIK
jgi:hypothetical protein